MPKAERDKALSEVAKLLQIESLLSKVGGIHTAPRA